MGKALFLFTLLGFSVSWAASPSLPTLSDADFEKVSKEFAGNFTHASVLGAATLGDIFGFELGLTAGQTTTPDLDAQVKKNSSDGMPNLYHAGLLFAVSVPLGFTGEVVWVPSTSGGGTTYEERSMALKLTLNQELLAVIPFNLALRVFSSDASLEFKQNTAGIDGTVQNKTTVTGFQILASPALPLFEPYVGIGFLQGKNSLGVSGAGSLYADLSSSKEASMSSTQLLAGINANLLFLRLGLEYSKAFDANKYTAKLAFGF